MRFEPFAPQPAQVFDRVSGPLIVGYPIYDDHGNMIATLGKNGVLADQRSYDAWGVIRTGNTTGEPHGQYCANLGHLADDESGLIYMRARYYDAGSGRFLAQDSSHQGTNWYVYCGNNPVNRCDFSGRFWWFFVAMAFIGMVASLSSYCMYQMASGGDITAGGLIGYAILGIFAGLVGGVVEIASLAVVTAASCGELIVQAIAMGVLGAGGAALAGAVDGEVSKSSRSGMGSSGLGRVLSACLGEQFLWLFLTSCGLGSNR